MLCVEQCWACKLQVHYENLPKHSQKVGSVPTLWKPSVLAGKISSLPSYSALNPYLHSWIHKADHINDILCSMVLETFKRGPQFGKKVDYFGTKGLDQSFIQVRLTPLTTK